MPNAKRRTLQLKITLRGTNPSIWRRVLLPDHIHLGNLHIVIQIAMGWTDSHMHQFFIDGKYYGASNPGWEPDSVLDEDDFLARDLIRKEKMKFVYEYDFGGSWEHEVFVEKILPFDPEQKVPVCLKAVGGCPPEDVGGIPGYYHFLEAWQDPKHPDHEELREWAEDDFDPGDPDVGEINRVLAECCP